MKFEHLDKAKHDRQTFDCGVDTLNKYLFQYANQDQKRSLSRIYVLVTHAGCIIGYYSICAHSTSRKNLPNELKVGGYDDIPFILLGRLAVDKKYQGKGYGDTLIFDAFFKTAEYAERFGIFGMIVDAKNEKAALFYEGFGFKKLISNPKKLVLPMSIITKLVKG